MMYLENIIDGSSAAKKIFHVKMEPEIENYNQEKLHVCTVDLSGCDNKSDLLVKLGSAMNFPEYFTTNWDSFEECLADLEWFGQGVLVIVIKHSIESSIEKNVINNFFAICRDVAIEWEQEQERKLIVIFVGETPVIFCKAVEENGLRVEEMD